MAEISAQERAERSRDAMWLEDAASKWVGMRFEHIAPGETVLSMEVQPHHCNGHNICHGGVSYTLADSAFAFACNSYNRMVVAQNNSISYLAPAYAGDTLTAHAMERVAKGRSSIYDVTVINQNGDLIAEFRGGSRVIRGQHFDEETQWKT